MTTTLCYRSATPGAHRHHLRQAPHPAFTSAWRTLPPGKWHLQPGYLRHAPRGVCESNQSEEIPHLLRGREYRRRPQH